MKKKENVVQTMENFKNSFFVLSYDEVFIFMLYAILQKYEVQWKASRQNISRRKANGVLSAGLM